MEPRLSINEVIRWLKVYRDLLDIGDVHRQVYHSGAMDAVDDEGVGGVYQQLVLESILMDINSMRTWVQMSISRLTTFARRTGEFDAIDSGATGVE